MRIPSGTTDQYIYFVAVDATDFTTRETGLSSFTVYRSRNGAAAAAMTTPTINETDATNMPGVYELLLDEDMTIGSGNDSEEMAFHITATGMAPVTRTIELYRPKITAGETIGVSSGAVTNVTTVATTTTNTDMRGTDSALLASSAPTNFGDLAITASTGRVTVGTNNDKTGYSISGTITTLDALDAAQDTQHSTTQSAIATVDTVVDAILADTGTDGVVLSAATCNQIADHILRRTFANAVASSDGDTVAFRSMLGAVAKLVNRVAASGSTLTIYREDDSTSLGTQTLTTNASADPITEVDTN